MTTMINTVPVRILSQGTQLPQYSAGAVTLINMAQNAIHGRVWLLESSYGSRLAMSRPTPFGSLLGGVGSETVTP